METCKHGSGAGSRKSTAEMRQGAECRAYSTLKFAAGLHDNLITTGKTNIKSMNLVWNMVDGRERTSLYHAYDDIIAELGLNVMQTFIPDSKRFRREMDEAHRPVFRSTIFPIDKSLIKGSNIEELVDEFIKIVKQ